MNDDTPTTAGSGRRACASCGKEFSAGEITCSDDGTTLTPIHKESLSGIVAGKYEVVGELAGGGWGTVYKARHILLNRFVAIKTLHPHMVASGMALKRFKQEALAGSQLDHPHILNVLDFGITDEGIPYIVMDFLQGSSLAETLQAGGFLEPGRAAKIFSQVASALAHAHRNGVVHRDLKPGNIMLVEHDGQPDHVKIVDFGIAKMIRKDEEDETSRLTETGQLFGSPLYMSPEQCTGKNLDGRSDIYSMGCVMYRTLTGQPPFQVKDLPDCIYKHVNETPAHFDYVCPDRPIPKELEAIVYKALEKEPGARFQTMTELEHALNDWLAGKPVNLFGSTKSAVAVTDEQSATVLVSTPTAIDQVSPAQLEHTISEIAADAQSTPTPTVAANSSSSPTADAASATTGSGIASNTGTSGAPVGGLAGAHSTSMMVLALVATAFVVLLPVAYLLWQNAHHDAGQQNEPAGKSVPTKTDQSENMAVARGGTPVPGVTDPSLKDGISSFNNGRYQEALALFAGAANKTGRSDALLWEGETLNALGRYTEAKKFLKDYMKHSEEAGVNAARGLNALASACIWLGQTDEAQGYLDRAEAVTSKLKGPDRVVYAQTLRLLAGLALINLPPDQKSRDARAKNAKELLQKSLAINSQYDGPPLEKAKIEKDLGRAHQALREYPQARECYNLSLAIRRGILRPDNPAIADSLMWSGYLDYQQKNFASAEKQFSQALSIDLQALGENNLDVAWIEMWLGVLNERSRNYPKALDYYKKAYDARLEQRGENDSLTIEARNSYYSAMRKYSHR